MAEDLLGVFSTREVNRPSAQELLDEMERKREEKVEQLFSMCATVESHCKEIRECTEELQDMQQTSLHMPGSTYRSHRGSMTVLREQMQQLVNKIRGLAREASTLIKKIERDIDEEETEYKEKAALVQARNKRVLDTGKWEEPLEVPSGGLIDMKKMQHAALLSEFLEVMGRFQKVHDSYQVNCSDRLKRQMKLATGHDITDDEAEKMLMDTSRTFPHATNDLMGYQQVHKVLSDVKERHDELAKMEAALTEIHNLFQDVVIMIEAQGTLLTNIQKFVSHTHICVTNVRVNLKEAEFHRRSARKKRLKCYLCISGITLIVVAGVVVFFVMYFKKDSQE